jgi:LysM domain-containing protein
MKIHRSLFLIIALLLSGCGAKPSAIVTPSQIAPTPTFVVQQSTTAVPLLIPARDTAATEVLVVEPTLTTEPTATAAGLIMEIVGGSEQTPAEQSGSCHPRVDWVPYTVQHNDTLSSLAQRTGTSWQQIQTANCLPSTTIFAGQRLLLPFIPLTANNPAGGATFESPAASTAIPTIEVPSAPNPGDPDMAVTPKQGPAGTSFVFTLVDFAPGETVTFVIKTGGNFQEVYRTTVQMSSLGNALVTYPSPANAESRLYVVQAQGSKSASTDFTITAP